MKNICLIVGLIIAFLTISCSSKKLGSKYEFEKFSEGDSVYYLIEIGVDSPGGVFDGIVKEIGWRDDEVLARVIRLSSSDPSGWYIFNLKSGKVSGPIHDDSTKSKFSVVDSELFYTDPVFYKQ